MLMEQALAALEVSLHPLLFQRSLFPPWKTGLLFQATSPDKHLILTLGYFQIFGFFSVVLCLKDMNRSKINRFDFQVKDFRMSVKFTLTIFSASLYAHGHL